MNNINLSKRVERMVFLIPEVLKRLFRGISEDSINLPPAQTKVLHTIGHKGQQKMSELSQFLGVEMSTMTVVVDALVKQGYVQRKSDENDRRVVLVDLTAKGKENFKKIKEQMKKNITKLFANLSEANQNKMIDSFEKIYKIFIGVEK